MPSLEAEDSIENINFGNDEDSVDKTQSGPVIGIIYPPPEVRSILNLKPYQRKTQPF